MSKPIFLKFGMYIMAPEPISVTYFINPSHQSVCLYVYPPLWLLGNGSVDTFPWQQIHVTIEELLEASSPIWSTLYQRRVCGLVCVSPYHCWQWLGKHIPTAMKNYWRHHLLCGLCCIKGKQAINSYQKLCPPPPQL
jgi:hypothetical protein